MQEFSPRNDSHMRLLVTSTTIASVRTRLQRSWMGKVPSQPSHQAPSQSVFSWTPLAMSFLWLVTKECSICCKLPLESSGALTMLWNPPLTPLPLVPLGGAKLCYPGQAPDGFCLEIASPGCLPALCFSPAAHRFVPHLSTLYVMHTYNTNFSQLLPYSSSILSSSFHLQNHIYGTAH